LRELWLLDVIVKDSRFQPILKLKELKKIVTNNTFSTRDFAELNLFRPDIECHYAAAYHVRQIEYLICKKCGADKFEFSGNDLLRRTFCPNCNKKKVEELTKRFEDIKAEVARVEAI
jgi:Zn finger protein HypA/HybF involved in hydrogenase expression